MTPEIKNQIDAVANTVTLPINWELTNCYLAIKYYDADPRLGAYNEVTPSAGTITVKARLEVHDKLVDITDGVFDCTVVNQFASFVGNAGELQAVPAGVTGAAFYELVAIQNWEA